MKQALCFSCCKLPSLCALFGIFWYENISKYNNSRVQVKMTHPGGCKNWFELWNGTSLKYEEALSIKLRNISPIRKQKSLKLQNNKCKTCWTCISREWHSYWPAGPKLTPTRCNSSFCSTSFPFSCVKKP